MAYVIGRHLNRSCVIMGSDDPRVPPELFSASVIKPDLSGFPYPLPCRKDKYFAFVADGDVAWYAADGGLTRYDKAAARDADRLMYFSAERDLPDNHVRHILLKDGVLWAECATGVAAISMIPLTGEEKADVLLKETLECVDRRGMVSQRTLAAARDLSSAHPYGHSDNDGGFTAAFVIGEVFHYRCLLKELGPDDPKTVGQRELTMRSLEACLLLMKIHGRGDGYIARSYITKDEVLPSDGLFFRKQGGFSVCLDTPYARELGISGKSFPTPDPVPDRLAALYRAEGYTDDDIIWKGDTSSDEVTLHFLMLLVAWDYFAEDDKELRDFICGCVTDTISHIVEHGFRLLELDGRPTTWARWDPEYFDSVFGHVDACLNSAEMLMYLNVAHHITGDGRWREVYDHLIRDLHYADLPLLHYDRHAHECAARVRDCAEEMMYGDNMLAVASFCGLLATEKDPVLRDKYERAVLTWDHSLLREVTPGYTFPLAAVSDRFGFDGEATVDWFRHINISRLASSVSLSGRLDVPVRMLKGGYKETGWLLQPDERFISKYDRDPLEYKDEDSGGLYCVESCYFYTFAYWIGRYFGFVE